MPDLKQISHEIAQAIFDSIEQDRTLILSRIADVIHKELAVRLPERKEPEPQTDSVWTDEVRKNPWLEDHRKAKAERWRQMKEFMEGTFSPFPDPPKQTATAVRERVEEEDREARRANAAYYQKMKELMIEQKINPPRIVGDRPELDRPLPEPRWIAWDFAAKKREIS